MQNLPLFLLDRISIEESDCHRYDKSSRGFLIVLLNPFVTSFTARVLGPTCPFDNLETFCSDAFYQIESRFIVRVLFF